MQDRRTRRMVRRAAELNFGRGLLATILAAAFMLAFGVLAHVTGQPAFAALGFPFLIGALPAHSGAGSMDLGVEHTKREDISELLLASLSQETTLLGLITVGDDFVDPEPRWNEDSLNVATVIDTTAGGQNATDASSVLNVTQAEADSLMNGTVLFDEGETYDTGGNELVQITGINGMQITVSRGFASTTKVTHAQNAVWRLLGPLLPENSDLDKDISKPRLANSNVISRFGLNVNISEEQILRAKYGYAVGVPDEIDHQLVQRTRELKRQINNALIYSRRTPAAGTTPGDYSAMEGILGFLLSGATDENAPFTPDMANDQYATVFGDGGDPAWLVLGTTLARQVANTWSDRIRITQSDDSRGTSVLYFDTDLARTLRIVLDPYFPAQAFALIDPDRIRLRPFVESFLYYRTAESFRDGEAARLISKMSLEMRNTKSVAAGGAGRAHGLSVRAT